MTAYWGLMATDRIGPDWKQIRHTPLRKAGVEQAFRLASQKSTRSTCSIPVQHLTTIMIGYPLDHADQLPYDLCMDTLITQVSITYEPDSGKSGIEGGSQCLHSHVQNITKFQVGEHVEGHVIQGDSFFEI